MANRPFVETFNVVVLYSNDAATAQVMKTYGRIKSVLDQVHPVDIHLWLLDMLEEPDLLAAASEDLENAAMIVVDVSDARVGSDAFERWVENWPTASPGKPRALVAFHPEHCRIFDSTRSLEFLSELAARKGMDLISNVPLRSDPASDVLQAYSQPRH